MISKKMAEEINEQIREEIYSGYLYLSMSSYASLIGLEGVAKWFFIQSQEEMTHVLRFYNYLNSQGKQVVLKAIDQPPAKFKSAKEMFAAALKHEQHITSRIDVLSDLAVKEKDHATEIFLQWFVSEQVEEEENANRVLAQLKLAGDEGGGLFMIDRELGLRAFTMPTDLTLP